MTIVRLNESGFRFKLFYGSEIKSLIWVVNFPPKLSESRFKNSSSSQRRIRCPLTDCLGVRYDILKIAVNCRSVSDIPDSFFSSVSGNGRVRSPVQRTDSWFHTRCVIISHSQCDARKLDERLSFFAWTTFGQNLQEVQSTALYSTDGLTGRR